MQAKTTSVADKEGLLPAPEVAEGALEGVLEGEPEEELGGALVRNTLVAKATLNTAPDELKSAPKVLLPYS